MGSKNMAAVSLLIFFSNASMLFLGTLSKPERSGAKPSRDFSFPPAEIAAILRP